MTLRLPVVLTRAPGSNTALRSRLVGEGWEVLEWPGVAIEPVQLQGVWPVAEAVALVSPSAARAWVGAVRDRPEAVFSQGPGTSAALVEAGVTVRAEAHPATAAGLAETIVAHTPAGASVVIVCGDRARAGLASRLREQGRDPHSVVLYRNRAPERLQYPPEPLHAVVYASPSAAERLLGANPWLRAVPAVAIGVTTSAWLEGPGQHLNVGCANSPTVAGLVAALARVNPTRREHDSTI